MSDQLESDESIADPPGHPVAAQAEAPAVEGTTAEISGKPEFPSDPDTKPSMEIEASDTSPSSSEPDSVSHDLTSPQTNAAVGGEARRKEPSDESTPAEIVGKA